MAIFSWFLYIPILDLPGRYGITAIIWLIPCGELFSILIKVFINYIYMHKRIFRLKLPWYQAFIAPIISTTFIYIMGWLYVQFIFFPMSSQFGTLWALLPFAIVFAIIVPFFVYMPLTAIFGSWDKAGLAVIEKSVKISGLGKLFIKPMFKGIRRGINLTKLSEKYAYDNTLAIQQERELMLIKNEKTKKKFVVL